MTREEQAQYICEKLMENPEFRKAFVGAITDAVNEVVKVIKALEQELCTDAIRRQDAIDELYKMLHDCFGADDEELDAVITTLNELPPVTAEKVGRWRHYEGMLICSECGAEFYDDIMEYCGDDVPKYCPDCGAKMQEVEDNG